jgi:hypothetical protein
MKTHQETFDAIAGIMSNSFYVVYTIDDNKPNVWFTGDKSKCLEFMARCQEHKLAVDKLNSFMLENGMNSDFTNQEFNYPLLIGEVLQCLC